MGASGSCLDVQGSLPADGAPIILMHCDGRASQHWSVADGGIIGIGGKCLDVLYGGTSDRTPVILSQCRGTPSQQWSVQ
ncbi:MAG: ricin-type beta-trefoil lectin domain protein [Rhodospirillales bacterium]